ncbi:MAG: chemotaxis signal transduction protein [Chlamydiales bacterium]|jgi:chemotaxis-related protein WspD|nr:chemotaxis signal transduction protein [Chlamydiales bacterium]
MTEKDLEQNPSVYDSNRCWNEIGVWSHSTPTCPKLQEYIHCHNCPVFIKSGRSLFQRPHPIGYLEEWSSILTQPKKEIRESSSTLPLLVFRVESNWFGLSPLCFKEIVDLRTIQPVPHRSNQVFLGLVNIHGQLQLCISLSGLFQIPPATNNTYRSYPRLIVIQYEKEIWSFIADEIIGIERFAQSSLKPAPIPTPQSTTLCEVVQWSHSHYGRIDIGILDEQRFFKLLHKQMQ